VLPIAPTLPDVLPIAPALPVFEPHTPPTSPTHVSLEYALDDADAPEYAEFKIDYGEVIEIPKLRKASTSKKAKAKQETVVIEGLSDEQKEICDALYSDM
jgi:hypothetical protein